MFGEEPGRGGVPRGSRRYRLDAGAAVVAGGCLLLDHRVVANTQAGVL